MKILYVTGIWNGFDETIFRKAKPGSGLPAFWKPLDYILEQGHDVHFITIEGDTVDMPINSGDARIGPNKFIERIHYQGRFLGKLQSATLLKNSVRRALRNQHYDFVYLHGPTAGVCRSVVKECGVPFGQRLYGTFLWRDLKKYGVEVCRFLRRNEFLSFCESKCFLLVTNDGSGGNHVYNKITPKPTPFNFFYWINGVDRPTSEELIGYENLDFSSKIVPNKFIFYCARFDRWKRQDRAIQVLSQLVGSSPDLKLVFAGDDREHYAEFCNEVRALAVELGVEDRVMFLGHITRPEILLLHHYALSSLFLFDVCNLTNALHEAIAAGGAVIVLNDPTMAEYIVDGENGFLCNSVEEAASVVQRLQQDPDMRASLSKSARLWSESNLLTWNERAQKELDLITACVSGGKN